MTKLQSTFMQRMEFESPSNSGWEQNCMISMETITFLLLIMHTEKLNILNSVLREKIDKAGLPFLGGENSPMNRNK